MKARAKNSTNLGMVRIRFERCDKVAQAQRYLKAPCILDLIDGVEVVFCPGPQAIVGVILPFHSFPQFLAVDVCLLRLILCYLFPRVENPIDPHAVGKPFHIKCSVGNGYCAWRHCAQEIQETTALQNAIVRVLAWVIERGKYGLAVSGPSSKAVSCGVFVLSIEAKV